MFQSNRLQLECESVELFEEEYKKKLDTYQQVSMAVNTKLYNLWLWGSQLFSTNYCKSLDILDFVLSVRQYLRLSDTVIAQDVQTTQLVSYTTPGKSSYNQARCRAHHSSNMH
jgi:hypothetical protein